MTMCLHRWCLPDPVSLGGAVAAFRTVGPDWEQARVLLYTPRECRFDWLGDGSGLPADTFEARIFCGQAELRWLRDPLGAGEGQAVLLGEEPASNPAGFKVIDKPAIINRLDRTYILWGRGTGKSDAVHSLLGTARIGTLKVPAGGVAADQSVALTAVEYVAEDQHGNAHVLDERLTGLAPAKIERVRTCDDD